MILQLLLTSAAAAGNHWPLTDAAAPATTAATCTREKKVASEQDNSDGEGIANLPYAMGKSFATLDAYLKHLECFAGPIDMPWWRQVRPGVYEHMKTATNAVPETATRDELMKRFGFTQ